MQTENLYVISFFSVYSRRAINNNFTFLHKTMTIQRSCIMIKININFIFTPYYFQAFKSFIKPFEAPRRSVKIKIKIKFLSSSGIGVGRVNFETSRAKQMCYVQSSSVEFLNDNFGKTYFKHLLNSNFFPKSFSLLRQFFEIIQTENRPFYF